MLAFLVANIIFVWSISLRKLLNTLISRLMNICSFQVHNIVQIPWPFIFSNYSIRYNLLSMKSVGFKLYEKTSSLADFSLFLRTFPMILLLELVLVVLIILMVSPSTIEV